jgi:hypothetical protein
VVLLFEGSRIGVRTGVGVGCEGERVTRPVGCDGDLKRTGWWIDGGFAGCLRWTGGVGMPVSSSN